MCNNGDIFINECVKVAFDNVTYDNAYKKNCKHVLLWTTRSHYKNTNPEYKNARNSNFKQIPFSLKSLL